MGRMPQTGNAGKPLRASATPPRLESVSRACSLLRKFEDGGEKLTLAELVRRTGLEKTIAFRLIHTLEAEGFVRSAGDRRYCLNIKILNRKAFRIGYAAEGPASPFSAAVTESVRWAATNNEIDLVLLDNRNSARVALQNARRLVGDRVDLAIEVQEHSKIAPAISSFFHDAAIPLIAVGVPHPGATFYGIDNYRVGRAAGRVLVKWTNQNWQGQTDELLLLGEDAAGSLPRLRLSGVEDLIRETISGLSRVQYLDARGKFPLAFELVRRHLRFSRARKILFVGVNDEAALGGLQAFEQSGRSQCGVAVALGGTLQARLELRLPGTREPQIITPQNVDQFYPTDHLRLDHDATLW
jgi:ribose transport system substrate-binding protein